MLLLFYLNVKILFDVCGWPSALYIQACNYRMIKICDGGKIDFDTNVI